MPRDSAGNYTLPAGNPVISGTIISSSWANTTMDDLALAMTDSLSRTGSGGMLAPLYFQNGTENNPSCTFVNGPTFGLWFDEANDELGFTGGGDGGIKIDVNGKVFIEERPIQQDLVDFTAGALMGVGAFGLGASSPPLVDDLTVDLKSGFYAALGDTTIGGPDTAPYWAGVTVARASGFTTFLYVRVVSLANEMRAWVGGRAGETGTVSWDEIMTQNNVQSSPYDATLGQLMGVGAFGLGSAEPDEATDLDVLTETGFYFTQPNIASNPEPLTSYQVLHINRASQFAVQLAIPRDGLQRMWTRQNSGNVWTAWERYLSVFDIQDTPTDETAGALLTVGAFGLGGAAPQFADFNTLDVSGYYYGSSPANEPYAGQWMVYQLKVNALYSSQIAVNFDDGNSYTRVKNNNVWAAWRKIDNTNAVFTGSITEQVGAISTVLTAAGGTMVSLQPVTTVNLTDGMLEGQSITLMVNANNQTVNWPAMTWLGVTPPALVSNGFSCCIIWKQGGLLYGSHAGDTI